MRLLSSTNQICPGWRPDARAHAPVSLSHGASQTVKRRAIFTRWLRRGSFRKQARRNSRFTRERTGFDRRRPLHAERAHGHDNSRGAWQNIAKRAFERERRAGENPKLASFQRLLPG